MYCYSGLLCKELGCGSPGFVTACVKSRLDPVKDLFNDCSAHKTDSHTMKAQSSLNQCALSFTSALRS